MENNNLWEKLCDYKNLEFAFEKARKGKTQKDYVIEFENNLENNLLKLRNELLFDYDDIYNFLEGWVAHVKNADTYRLRKKTLKPLDKKFCKEVSIKEINRHTKTSFN